MRITAVFAFATVALVGCGVSGSDAEDTLSKGQVLATMGDQEITIHELNAELQNLALPSGDKRKAAEQAILQQLVNRTILAQAARERELGDSPEFLLQEKKLREQLLVQLLQRQIASKIRPGRREEVERFINANPNLFSQRKIILLDRIEFPRPENLSDLAVYEDIGSMEEAEQRLIEDGIRFQRLPGIADAVRTNPELVQRLLQLPQDEVFIMGTGASVVVGSVTGVRTEPIIGNEAFQLASDMLQRQKVEEAVQKELAALIQRAQPKVKYQEGYRPAKSASE